MQILQQDGIQRLRIATTWGEFAMRPLLLPLSPRYILLTIALAGTTAFAAAAWRAPSSLPYFLLPLALFGAFAILGIRDLTQRKHEPRRRPAAHVRPRPTRFHR